jgi:hypothetical protein
MEKWFIPRHMQQLANTTVNTFKYDQSGKVNYTFDSVGFRNNNELTNDPHLIVIGNSISFGIGLENNHTFARSTASKLNLPCYNVSVGAVLHENHDYLPTIHTLANRQSTDVIVLQINNLSRIRVNSTSVIQSDNKNLCQHRFLNYFNSVRSLLKNKHLVMLYWDDQDYQLPILVTDQILIHNKFHLDCSISDNLNTFGIQSHQAISKILLSKI